MTPAEAIASYRASFARVGEDVIIRRDGEDDIVARARPFGQPIVQLVGEVTKSSRRLIVLAEKLGPLLPLIITDVVVLRGKTLTIDDPDADTRRIAGTLIALEIMVSG